MPKFTTADGLNLDYQDAGTGEVILCLAGLTRNGRDFDAFRAAFKPHARIISLTSRGREPSDFDPNWENYTVLQESQDALALLEHLGVDRAMILGSSRGGLIAMLMNAIAPERVAGVVFNDIGPVLETDGLARILGYLGKKPPFKTIEEAAHGLALFGQADFTDFTVNDWLKAADLSYRFDETGAQLRYDPKLRHSFEATDTSIDLWPFYDALAGKPLGVVWGMNSDILIESTIEEMVTRNLNLKIAALPNRGHIPVLNEPAAIDIITQVFIDSFKGPQNQRQKAKDH